MHNYRNKKLTILPDEIVNNNGAVFLRKIDASHNKIS
jgi:hypothetical protein